MTAKSQPIILPSWSPTFGPVSDRLCQYLYGEGNVLPDEDSARRVLDEARQILMRCVKPETMDATYAGLVCGLVQSGKTASMTAVAALAMDNGYRIIILMAGVTTNLVDQNRRRLDKHLRAAVAPWSLIMMVNPRAESSEMSELQSLVTEWRASHYQEQEKRTLFITVLKHHARLKQLTELLGSVDLRGIPAIIFDDEADQASLNTMPKADTGLKVGSKPKADTPSATYRHIFDLRSKLPSHTFLQYTATPQAPLLISRIDSLSADFAELLSPGDAYTGGKVFFRERPELVCDIPPEEIFTDKKIPESPPETLVQALQIFFVEVAIGHIQRDTTNRSMLIHPSKSTVAHAAYHGWVMEMKKQWHALLLSRDEPDRTELHEEFADAYSALAVF